MESTTVEYKREYIDDIKYAVVAFANTEGGRLYIGLNDDGSVFGVDDVDETMLRLTNMIRDAIRPDITMFTHCTVEERDGRNIIVLDVLKGTGSPYYLKSKGVRPEGVYVRHGASSAPASETAILSMIRESSGDCFETSRSLEQDLTFDYARGFFERMHVSFGIPEMKTLGLIGKDGTYSNLGMLLSDQNVHTIKLAVFQGTDKVVFRDRFEFTGSLLKQLEDAYQKIDMHNRTRSELEGLYRKDMKDYPEDAVREALLNAIIHREYSLSASTLISIFDDRIEFVTVGGLVRGISYDDMMLGVSVSRNSKLANVFYRLKLVEFYGTGINKIRKCYETEYVQPRIDVSSNAFKIVLPNKNHDKEIAVQDNEYVIRAPDMENSYHVNYRVGKIVALCREKHFIIRRDVDELLSVSQTTSSLLLKDMVESGILKKEGSARNVRYSLRD